MKNLKYHLVTYLASKLYLYVIILGICDKYRIYGTGQILKF